MLGKRFAIHAAKSWDDDGAVHIHEAGLRFPPQAMIARGAIVALATIDHQVIATTPPPGSPHRHASTLPVSQKRWFFGPYGYVFRDLAVLAKPVPCRGMQGFWAVPDEVTEEVLGHLVAIVDGHRLARDVLAAYRTGNRNGNDDSIPRCSNTNASGVCMYVGPCLECSNNRGREAARVAKHAKLHLGAIVHVKGFRKGSDRAHVVVAGPRDGLVKLAYCATERWYMAKWYAIEFVITEVDDKNPHVRRARRWLAAVVPEADGWKRIQTGRFGQPGSTETVGHVDLVPVAGTLEDDEANSGWRDWT